MRTLLLSALLLVAALGAGLLTPPAAAQDKAKPNTLTPKEIADGWILLFDGETTFGWIVNGAEKSGHLKVTDSVLDLTELGKCVISSTTQLKEFELRFECAGADDPTGRSSFFIRGVDSEGRKQHMQLGFSPRNKWMSVDVRAIDGEIE